MRFFLCKKWFTLASNMQISSFNLIIHNYRNWAASSALISPHAIIFSWTLICSSDIYLSSCISLTCCSLGALSGFIFGTYDGIYLVSLEVSTEWTTDGNLEGLLLGAWLLSLYVIELSTDVGNGIVLYDGKFIVTTLGDLYGISLVTYDGTVLRS